MKRDAHTRNRAAVLNFLVPGAGLWYIGLKFWGVVNLFAASLIVVLLAVTGPFGEQIHYIILMAAAGSAGLAHALAARTNRSTPVNSNGNGQKVRTPV